MNEGPVKQQQGSPWGKILVIGCLVVIVLGVLSCVAFGFFTKMAFDASKPLAVQQQKNEIIGTLTDDAQEFKKPFTEVFDQLVQHAEKNEMSLIGLGVVANVHKACVDGGKTSREEAEVALEILNEVAAKKANLTMVDAEKYQNLVNKIP